MTSLQGCQSIGEHFNCMAEVDRTVPAQTQQRYVRTDTKCSTSGGAIATPTTTRGDQYIVNNNSQTNCTSTPIYETIVLNQDQRDAAYQKCRNNLSNQKLSSAQEPYRGSVSNSNVAYIQRQDAQRAKCDSIKDNDAFLACMREARPPSAPLQPRQEFTDAEWKAKVEKAKQVQTELLKKKRAAEDSCLSSGLTPNTPDFSKCVYKESNK